jgi:sulfite exporter TauE/SafE
MESLILAFVTGLTTGGLSCLAVQGGLLAGSLARQIEQDLLTAPARGSKGGPRPNTALPIALFLLAKLAAYTLLGALLGLAGAFLTLDPITRAVLMIAIGVFMVGNGLRMLNVHPIFRFFVIEPPRFITRYIRRTAKGKTDFSTPLFLGALTVLIPCGVTQAMMAAALGTGSAAAGAALMFAFTLGTSPVFFLVAYLATELGARLQSYFLRFVAVVVLILGLITIESGLNVLGSPLSFANLTARLWPAAEPPAAAVAAPTSAPVLTPAVATNTQKSPTSVAPGAQKAVATPQSPAAGPVAGPANVQITLELTVLNNGYVPRVLRAPANRPVSLALTTNKTYSCARDFVIPALKYYQLLPETGRVTVEIPAQKPGTVMRFACSMGMYTGQILFDG